MLRSYLLSSIRSFRRDKLYALLNISGLTLGIGCSLVLGLYLNYESSYDRHHVNGDRIFRIVNELAFSGIGDPVAWTSQSLGPLLQLDNPGSIQSYTRLKAVQSEGSTMFRAEDSGFYWDKVFFADANIFNVFSHNVIAGEAATALQNPESIAISESFALAYFGTDDPIGQIVSTETKDYEVALVFGDLPANSHLRYDALLPFSALGPFPSDEAGLLRQLGDLSLYTYVQVAPEFTEADFELLFNQLIETRFEPLAQALGLTDYSVRFWPQNIADIHYQSNVGMDEPTGNPFYLFAFTAVAVFILLIACINYVNLATARFISRRKEVGIRKTIGAARSQLISQFLGESISYVLISSVLALVIAAVILEFGLLDGLLNHRFRWQVLFSPAVLSSVLVLGIIVGAVSGIYPALYLTAITPKQALTSHSLSVWKQKGLLRQFLVLVQFTISISIIACTLIMLSQIRYLSGLSLGFEDDNRLLVTLRGAELIDSFPVIRNELMTHSDVVDVALTQHLPGSDLGFFGLNVETEEGEFELRSASLMTVGNNFVEVMDMSIVQGRSFLDPSPEGLGQNLLVNQVFADQMQWRVAIGKRIRGFAQGTVVGVVQDFNLESLHQPIGPVILRYDDINYLNATTAERATASRTMVVQVANEDVDEAIQIVISTLQRFDPIHPIEIQFLGERLNQLYASEYSTTRLSAVFAGICILISCLGLFGLAAFNTEKRTKEFGIRKILGATAGNIFWLLVRNFIVLIAISAGIASLITWLVMNQWLENFAYRELINPINLVLAILVVVLIAVATISIQSAKTIRTNPADVLRFD